MTDDTELPPPDPKETAALTGFVLGLPPTKAMTDIEIFRDFNAVFRSEQGQRVLAVILAEARFFTTKVPLVGTVDPYRTHIHEGQRILAIRILELLNEQPSVEKPTKTTTQRKTR